MTKRKQIFIFPALLFFALPITVSAATISLRTMPDDVGTGDVVLVSVLLDSTNATNAFSGNIRYSGNTLEPIAINDGNSIISLWITRPTISTGGTPIIFAGITPGGFSGTRGVLFSILFRAKAAGIADISLENSEVLRNDGAGGKEPVTTKPLILSIKTVPSGGYTEPVDHTPPEPFTAYLGKDPQLYDGRNYLVFTTVDKSSGIDRYAVVESRIPSFLLSFFPLSWTDTATSPYMIEDQNLTSTIYLKAVDRAGNERLSVFPLRHFFTIYEKVALLFILIIIVLLWWGRGWRRRFGKNL